MNSADAQQRPETGEWFTVNLSVNFSNHWQWHNEAGYRTLGTSLSALQYYYRSAARYTFNKHWSSAAGVAFFSARANFLQSEHEFGNEFRIWKEANYLHRLNEPLQLLFRFRTEQRFFTATGVKDKYTGYRFRVRPGLNQKLNNKWSLQLTDEYMRQAVKQKFLFDQNRLTFSTIYSFNRATQLQAGYMWLKWPKDNQHILTLTFTKNISLYAG